MMKSEVRKLEIMAEMLGTVALDPRSLRFLRPWIRSLRAGQSPLGSSIPWMNFKVIRWLREYLKPTMAVFEYGTGGSTIFLGRRVRSLTSIEHDPRWFDLVCRAVDAEGLRNCELRLVPAEPRPGLDAVPYGFRSYTSKSPEAFGQSFEAYVRTIDGVPDRSLDLALVDGYARLSCVAHAVPKMRVGGYLLFDDTDWSKHRPAFDYLMSFPRTDFVGVTPFQRNLRKTSIWKITDPEGRVG